jgi:hypothetical protein
MMILSHFRSNRGVAIVAVALLMVVGAILGAAVITQTSSDVQQADRTLVEKQELFIAESAKERAYSEIMNDETFANGGSMSDIALAGGTYDILATTLSPSPLVVEIQATGDTRMPGNLDPNEKRKRVTVVAEVIRENVCVWNNAIFGGSGQTGGVVKGNCAIHGSVHLLGDGVGAGNSSIEALDLSGTALIHNNYEGMPLALRAKVPALPTTEFGGQTIETLDAKLRVKNGAVGVSGNSEIGQMNDVTNNYKETMDGIYIETDSTETRWTGNQVIDGVPDPAHVQSDNGTDALYDLGDKVQMPEITDAYTDPDTGTVYTDYDTFFASPRALEIPLNLTLDDSNSAAIAVAGYTFPAGVTATVVGSTFTITDGTNTIAYNPAVAAGQALLTVNGMVEVQGDLVIGKKNLNISYSTGASGGTIYASGSTSNPSSDPGNIDVHSNLLPVTIFPTGDVLGLVAKNNMNLATGPGDSQLSMAGAFFAQNTVTSSKQNNIAGTFVCNYFDMGTNVPRIYQVPSLVDHLPPGLPGANPIWIVTGFEERSWRVDMVP